jgi:alpha-1,2-mannosyltransferase
MSRIVAAALGLATGIFALTAGLGLTGSWVAAVLIALVLAVLVAVQTWRRPIVPLDEAAASRGLKVLSGLATAAALVQLCRLAVFMVAPQETGYSAVPSSEWEIRHSCLSAYFVAAQAADSGANVYDTALYNRPDDDPKAPRKARRIGPFNVDVFEYPPPFLALPRTLRLIAPDFLRFRMLWFGLNCGIVLLASLVVARRLGPAAGTRALLLSPLLWVALPTLSTLQKGNVQALVIVASVMAMLLFERQRHAAGGALLAFATVSKLYPGMLIVFLLARRQWHALAWTAALGTVFCLWTLLDLGWAPYVSFLDHLPGLLGGEAFPAFRNPSAMAINLSVPGLVFKLKLFGATSLSFGASKIVGWIYTLAILAATWIAARRPLQGPEAPVVWLGILTLATLRSPFLPQAYGAFPSLWLLTLLAARYAPTARTLAATLLVWAGLNVFWPMDWPLDPRWLALATGIPQALTIALAVVAMRSRPREGWTPEAGLLEQKPARRLPGVPALE